MTATVIDIARLAGVSQPTVSQVLNGKGRISSTTRRRVFEAAQALGYRPNSYARAMLTRRTGNLGLLLSANNTRSKLLPGLMDGLQDAVIQSRLHLVVGRVSDEHLTNPEHVPKLLSEFAADGLLINYFQGVPDALRQLVKESELPVVWINSRAIRPCVYPDDHAGGMAATQWHLARGHRRIAYLMYERDRGPNRQQHYSLIDRHQGYLDAMAEAGLQPMLCSIPDEHVQHLTHDDVRVQRARQALFADAPPTAVVTYSVVDAVITALAATQAGLTVGKDLDIATFHSEPPAMLPFPVTVWIVPLRGVGHLAVSTLLDLIEHGVHSKEDYALKVPYSEPLGAV